MFESDARQGLAAKDDKQTATFLHTEGFIRVLYGPFCKNAAAFG